MQRQRSLPAFTAIVSGQFRVFRRVLQDGQEEGSVVDREAKQQRVGVMGRRAVLTSVCAEEMSHEYPVPWELLGGVRVVALGIADIDAMVWPARDNCSGRLRAQWECRIDDRDVGFSDIRLVVSPVAELENAVTSCWGD